MVDKVTKLISLIPKAELHSHLDGCVRPETAVKIAKATGVKYPTYDAKKFANEFLKDKYANLVEMLNLFGLFIDVMKTVESLEQVAYEYAHDYINDNVFYVEVRFAPQFHVGKNIKTIEEVLVAVNAGLGRAAQEHNSKPEVIRGEKPAFKYGIISCIMRSLCHGLSEYFDNLLDSFKYSDPKKAHVQAGKELVLASIIAKEKHKVPVVAIDLAGGENGNPCEDFLEPFELARKHLLNITIHAGEADGPESIFNAVAVVGAQRVGHALHLYDSGMSKRPNAADFSAELAQYLAKKKIGIEVNITSNMQTYEVLKTYSDHPLRKMMNDKLTTCICCDNKTISKTSISKEMGIAAKAFNLTFDEIKVLTFNSFDQCFYPGTQAEKLEYIQSVKKYYDKVEAEILASK